DAAPSYRGGLAAVSILDKRISMHRQAHHERNRLTQLHTLCRQRRATAGELRKRDVGDRRAAWRGQCANPSPTPSSLGRDSHASTLETEAVARETILRPAGVRRLRMAHSATARLMTQLSAISESCVSSFGLPATISATISTSIWVAAPSPRA